MNKDTPVLKVFVCDDTADYGIRIASKLNENNIYAYTRKKDAEVILNSIACNIFAVQRANPDQTKSSFRQGILF